MTFKIALAAETVLYAPILAAVEHINSSADNQDRILVQVANGDVDAYRRLRKRSVDGCVCDPMVILDKAPKQEERGIAVASLLNSVGLWCLDSTLQDQSSTERMTLEQLRRKDLSRANFLTYNKADTTAGRIVQHLVECRIIHNDGVALEEKTLGRELEYLFDDDYRTRRDPERKIAHILTCDLVAKLALELGVTAVGDAPQRPIESLSIRDSEPYCDQLFTCFIVAKSILRERDRGGASAALTRHEVALRIVDETQRRMDDMFAGGTRRAEAVRLAARNSKLTRLDQSPYKVQDPALIELITQRAVDELCATDVFARSLAISPTRWSVAREVWGFDKPRGSLATLRRWLRGAFDGFICKRFDRSLLPLRGKLRFIWDLFIALASNIASFIAAATAVIVVYVDSQAGIQAVFPEIAGRIKQYSSGQVFLFLCLGLLVFQVVQTFIKSIVRRSSSDRAR